MLYAKRLCVCVMFERGGANYFKATRHGLCFISIPGCCHLPVLEQLPNIKASVETYLETDHPSLELLNVDSK